MSSQKRVQKFVPANGKPSINKMVARFKEFIDATYDEEGNIKDIKYEKCVGKCKAFNKCKDLWYLLLLIGAPKAASSLFFNILSNYPFVIPTIQKECNFLCDHNKFLTSNIKNYLEILIFLLLNKIIN